MERLTELRLGDVDVSASSVRFAGERAASVSGVEGADSPGGDGGVLLIAGRPDLLQPPAPAVPTVVNNEGVGLPCVRLEGELPVGDASEVHSFAMRGHAGWKR